jgi:hypothetical protein
MHFTDSQRGIYTTCEGVTRRDFLRVGTLGLMGLGLADFFKPSQAATKDKNLIVLWLQGGPSHIDMWDLKPDAPSEFRGEFKPIPTNVAGIQISEHLSRTAKVVDKLCILRTVTSPEGSHERASRTVQTGYRPIPNVDFPSYGANYVKYKQFNSDVPAFVGVLKPSEQGYGAGFLGPRYNPFMAGDPSEKNFSVKDLAPPEGVNLDRITRRREMLKGFDDSFRSVDSKVQSLDPALERAYRLVFSAQARAAFDIAKEPDAMRDTYGRTPLGQGCLLARRLIEGGVKAVTVFKGGWDTHGQNFTTLKDKLLPELDQAYAALIADLSQRGLLENTLVVLMGEFGRTPKINGGAGRDHWPNANSVVLSGGGIKGGQVIGVTDEKAAEPKERPIQVADLAATIYAALGVNYHHENHTPEGRPVRIVSEGEPVKEAFGRTS